MNPEILGERGAQDPTTAKAESVAFQPVAQKIYDKLSQSEKDKVLRYLHYLDTGEITCGPN